MVRLPQQWYIAFPTIVKILVVVGLLSALGSPNPILSFYALLIIIIITRFCWVPGQAPVILFAVFFQWLQSGTQVFQANLAGETLIQYAKVPNAEKAVWISLTAVLIIGLILGRIARSTPFPHQIFHHLLLRVNVPRLFYLALLMHLLLPLLDPLKRGGLAQIIYSIQTMDWILYVILIFAGIRQKTGYIYVFSLFSLYFILGFTGFFSGFKEVFIFTAIAALFQIQNIKAKTIIYLTILTVPLFVLLSFWSVVKPEYRKYVRAGEKSQVVNVSQSEALTYLINEAKTIPLSALAKGMETALDRLQYTQMVQRVVDYVPAYTPHENGKLWQSAVTHIITPRALFPNKAVLDDSVIARKYTGIDWSGLEKGASIGIGFISESYVDFGLPFMFLPIAFYALVVGGLYRYFMSDKTENLLLNAGLVVPLVLQFDQIETAGNKILGGLIMTTLVFILLKRLLYPILLSIILRPIKQSRNAG